MPLLSRLRFEHLPEHHAGLDRRLNSQECSRRVIKPHVRFVVATQLDDDMQDIALAAEFTIGNPNTVTMQLLIDVVHLHNRSVTFVQRQRANRKIPV